MIEVMASIMPGNVILSALPRAHHWELSGCLPVARELSFKMRDLLFAFFCLSA